MVTVQTQPDMFSGGQPAKFEQVFDAADASVTVTTDIATVRVWVDALTDAIFVHCNSTDGTRPLKLHVHVQSVRPPTNTTLGQPDVLAKPMAMHQRVDAMWWFGDAKEAYHVEKATPSAPLILLLFPHHILKPSGVRPKHEANVHRLRTHTGLVRPRTGGGRGVPPGGL